MVGRTCDDYSRLVGQWMSTLGRSRMIQPCLVLPSHPRPTTRDEFHVSSLVRSVVARSIQVSSDS